MDYNTIEYWQRKCEEYKWMFNEHQDIYKGYRDICDEYQKKIKEKEAQIASLKEVVLLQDKKMEEMEEKMNVLLAFINLQ